ncbi:YdeI/OmpD-associated family protein [Brevibacillus fluminis]|uniref:YdeI/OmpD-associated family protein n=1 Tax=Brevibacillus fluminis TaxID=511487 RepID=UPI003F8C2120
MNSEKSIIDKLNLRKHPAKLILNKPADVTDFDAVEYDTTITNDPYDVIVLFVFQLEEFTSNVQMIIDKQLVAEKGYVYFAYPKKNNPQYDQYIERDSFFQSVPVDEDGYIQGSSLKFAKMVSLNDVFTIIGLKAEGKKAKKTSAAPKSQCVDDYIEHVEEIRAFFQERNKEILDKYNELTPGYQKDWARYVFSAKKKETQEKRLAEMETVLGEGYKTMDLYRRQKK